MAVPLNQIRTLQQAQEYAKAGWISANTLCPEAVNAYRTVYENVSEAITMGSNVAPENFVYGLEEANKTCDAARATKNQAPAVKPSGQVNDTPTKVPPGAHRWAKWALIGLGGYVLYRVLKQRK